MKTIWQARVVETTSRYAELAPATACCNACRTCIQTNLATAALAGLAAAGTFLAERRPRFSRGR